MRATTTALLALLLLAAAAAARDARSPDGSWTATVPDSWEPAKPEAYQNMPRTVHAIFMSAPDEEQKRALMQVSVIEKPLFVSKEGREEFRAACDAEIKAAPKAPGVQMGIEKVEMERIGDRDVYRTEGFQASRESPPVKSVKWYVPAADKHYVFSFVTSAKSYAYRVVEFEEIARTIRMREAPPVRPAAARDWSGVVTVAGIAVAALCAIGFVIVLKTQFKRAPEAGK